MVATNFTEGRKHRISLYYCILCFRPNKVGKIGVQSLSLDDVITVNKCDVWT